MKIGSSPITLEHVRLLLFKECDRRGRKLLFDSSTIEKLSSGKNDKPSANQNQVPCIVEVSEGFSYVYKGPAGDSNLLGEMIFGAVAINHRGVSLKIHIMDEPKRLMCTKVFSVPTGPNKSRRGSHLDRKLTEVNSCGDLRNASQPLNVPTQREEGLSLSFSLDRGDSGYCGEPSPYSSLSSTYDYCSMFGYWDESTPDDIYGYNAPFSRKLSTTSNGSWQRRAFRSVATRFNLGQSSDMLTVPSCDSQIYSDSNASGAGAGASDSLSLSGTNLAAAQRRHRLGLALLVSVTDSAQMDLVQKCVEHSPQLQALVCRLRLATLAAGSKAGGGFVTTLHHAAIDAANWISDLMYGPRLQSAWLSLVASDRPQLTNKTAETLLVDLCSVLSVGDTKHTNFFISTLLTYVLTYHLGWVTTVSPYDTIDTQTSSKDCNTEHRRPYNALWAQLSDLCGSIGCPPRAARTIISGATNTNFINRLLVVLTYFLRCGEVRRNSIKHQDCVFKESKVFSINNCSKNILNVNKFKEVPSKTSQDCGSACTLVASDISLKKSTTLVNLNGTLSSLDPSTEDCYSCERPVNGLRRNQTIMIPIKPVDSSRASSMSNETELDEKVVFVLGDNEKLIGLKNKSNGGKSVKKSFKVHNEPINLEGGEQKARVCAKQTCNQENLARVMESPTKCCAQTLQHSKHVKHSGFKFEFDKYPQIVTNYMKSKNLEILDRHYIGKPGNLKLDNFQFDPTIVPPIQEERCETCYKCQMESMLQTPTNASELEYMNDVPRQCEPQYAKESIVKESSLPHLLPKNFTRKRKENTVVVNVPNFATNPNSIERRKSLAYEVEREGAEIEHKENNNKKEKSLGVIQAIEFPLMEILLDSTAAQVRSGFDGSLLGGVTDRYVPDLILQGTTASPDKWERELRRDLDLTSHTNRPFETPAQSVAIIGDTSTWEVRVVGRPCGAGGMSALVGAMLDALPAMWHAKVPAHQCLFFLESKLREFCVMSKTLADMLMSTDFCDIATLTKSLNIDVNDVPLLLAVATTHTPQVARRYGISYR